MTGTRIDAELSRAQGLIGAGQFDTALPICQSCAQLAPDHAEAWFWLGYVQLLRGELQAAEAALTQAVRLAPGVATYWTNRSLVALGLGRAEEAERHARQAIAIDANDDAVWVNVGTALFHQRRFGEAAEAYRQALARQPQNAAAWANLAAATEQQGDLPAAQEAYERNLTLAPSPDIAMKFAALLIRRDQLPLAVHVLRQIVDQVPSMTMAWLVLGDALGLMGDRPAAEEAYRRALASDPNSRQAKLSLGLELVAHFRFGEAEALARQVVDANPRDAEAWALLATVQRGQAKIDEAIASSRRAVALAPEHLGHSRFLLGAMQYCEAVDAEQLLAEHSVWDETYARPLLPQPPPAVRQRAAGQPLRIGLVSSNFGRHPVAFLALAALEYLDKMRCSLVCYSDRFDEDEFTARFRASSDDWRRVGGWSDEDLVSRIREDEIDVLIDLMGHTGPRLLAFARKPAPLQATWLGYVGTTGLTAIDFLIADRFHVRPGEEGWYSEAVLRLPNSYACYGPPPYMPEVNPLPAAGSGGVTFGSFNNPTKFTPGLIDRWATILQNVPDSLLLLKFGGLDQQQAQAPIRHRFAQHGVDPTRILMEGNAPHPELLSAYQRIDIALDTQPYSGGVTTCEALWMGVPVITWPGRTFAGRHSTSYLSTTGLSEFIAADKDGYIDLAVQWASRLDELALLRRSLRSRVQQSPLCDAAGFASDWLDVLKRAVRERSSK